VFTVGHFSEASAGAWPFRFVPNLIRAVHSYHRTSARRAPAG
jgi:hypothetical protein